MPQARPVAFLRSAATKRLQLSLSGRRVQRTPFLQSFMANCLLGSERRPRFIAVECYTTFLEHDKR